MKNWLKSLGGRRVIAFSAAFILAVGVGVGWQRHATSARAEESTESRQLEEKAKKAVEAWASAVASGNAEIVRKFLAPEFQILRSDGKAYDKAQYLAGGMSKIDSIISVQDVFATEHGDLMVVRYVISLKASADGGTMQRSAPRLTVFRRNGDRWLVVAHANFAQLQK
jgi:ketosteroid isomerase-like protein